MHQLTREQLVMLLTEVSEYLEDKGVHGELYVVGGAAMALAFDARRITSDVDAVFAPTAVIREAARHVAGTHPDLLADEDWLNDAAKGLIPPGPAPEYQVALDLPGLRVVVPPPDYLLASKVYASRVDRDGDDIEFLANLLGITTSEEVLDVVTRYYPQQRLLPKCSLFIQQLFGPLRS